MAPQCGFISCLQPANLFLELQQCMQLGTLRVSTGNSMNLHTRRVDTRDRQKAVSPVHQRGTSFMTRLTTMSVRVLAVAHCATATFPHLLVEREELDVTLNALTGPRRDPNNF
jgi:hypothetical protein